MPVNKNSLTQMQATIERKTAKLQERREALRQKLLAKVAVVDETIGDLERRLEAAKEKRSKLLSEAEELK